MAFLRLVTGLSAALLLVSCTTTTPTAGRVIDETYSIGGYTWTSGATVYVHYKLVEDGGHVAICGAWSALGGGVSQADVGVGLEAVVLYLGGARIKQGISFLKRIDNPKKAKGKPAVCRRTSIKWRPEFDTADSKLRFPSMSFS